MFTLTGLTSTVVESVGRLRYGSCHPAVAGVGAVAGAVHLALYPCECQRFNDPPSLVPGTGPRHAVGIGAEPVGVPVRDVRAGTPMWNSSGGLLRGRRLTA
ncbi:hypothetical protein GCM10018963_31410 [Saccharothrix longispora]